MSRVETSPGVGAVLAGRYRLDARVGSGRTGTVFRALDQALNTTVAVKVLNSGPFAGADRTINVFRVNRVLAYRHDGLVRVQDVSLVPTAAARVLFLVEDWIDGRSFDAYIRGRNLLQNWEILEAFRQLSSALGFIHKIGVHGNLTPSNVLVVDGRRLVLTDCYDILGSPPPADPVAASFRAPELADTTSGREDPAADIWSLGMLLGMALLRSPVHPGVRLSAQGPGVPYEADAVFLRATEPDPRRRFGSVDEMVDAMRMALPGEPAVVEAVGFVGRQRSEVSITAETRTQGRPLEGRSPSALQVAPEEALDWVDESSPEIDWTDVETVAEWADEAGDWSAAEVLDDAAIEDIDDATLEVELDAVVPGRIPVAPPSPARTPTVPARTPTVPSRARSRTAPGLDVPDATVAAPPTVEALPASAPVVEASPLPEPEPVVETVVEAPGEPESEPTPATDMAFEPDASITLESGPDTVETVLEPPPAPTPLDDDELALAALTSVSPPPPLEAPPELEVDTSPAPAVELETEDLSPRVILESTADEAYDTIEIMPNGPPEPASMLADVPEPGTTEVSSVPATVVSEPAQTSPPVLPDDDDEPAPTLEVPMTFRADPPPLVLDVKAPESAPPPVATKAAPAAPVEDRGKGKKKNKQKANAVATASVGQAPPLTVADVPAPAAPPPSAAPPAAAPAVVAAIPVQPAAPTPAAAVAPPVTPAPPPPAPVSMAKATATASPPRQVPNTAVIATPKIPSPADVRQPPPPASKPMSWGVVLVGGFAAVIGIAVLVWFATSSNQSTPKVQKGVSVAPAAPTAAPSPGAEAPTLSTNAGVTDVAVTAAEDVGSPDIASAGTALTAVALDAGPEASVDVATDAAPTVDIAPDVSESSTTDAATDVQDVGDTLSALAEANDVQQADAIDAPDVATAAELPDMPDASPDVAAAPDVPIVAAPDTAAPVDTTASVDTAVAAGGVDLRFIPPELLACPTGMAKLSKKVKYDVGGQKQDGFETYCIDRREYPGAGMPRTGVGLYAAKGACERKGGRLCTGAEWRRGCGGTYPYGSTFDESRCNTMTLDGTSREVVATGSFGRCKSGYGLSDMVGNVAEWTADGMVRGGDAYKTGQEATCGFARRRAPDSGSPHVGFRCCADPVIGDAPAEESP